MMEVLGIMFIMIILAVPFAGCIGLSKLIKKHLKIQITVATILCSLVAFGMFGVIAPVYKSHFKITSIIQKKWIKTYDSGAKYNMIRLNQNFNSVVDQDWVWQSLKEGDKIEFTVIKAESYFGVDNHADQRRTKQFSSGYFFYPIGTPKEAKVN